MIVARSFIQTYRMFNLAYSTMGKRAPFRLPLMHYSCMLKSLSKQQRVFRSEGRIRRRRHVGEGYRCKCATQRHICVQVWGLSTCDTEGGGGGGGANKLVEQQRAHKFMPPSKHCWMILAACP